MVDIKPNLLLVNNCWIQLLKVILCFKALQGIWLNSLRLWGVDVGNLLPTLDQLKDMCVRD
jgi:hypothetical protein